MKRIPEGYILDGEVFSVTSGTTLYTKALNMEGISEAAFVFTMSTAPAGVAVPITIQQASVATAAESSGASSLTPACTTQIGSTVANYVYRARGAYVSISSAATDAQSIVVNDRTYTISTANAATSLQFGCTDGTTGAAGNPSSMANKLAALINSTVSSIGLANCTAALTSAASTTIEIMVKDTASTHLTITTTGGGITPSYKAAVVKISVLPDGMNSTSKYLSAVIGSAATAVVVGAAYIRKPSYGQSMEKGITKYHKAT